GILQRSQSEILDSRFRGNDEKQAVGRILVSDKTFNIPIIAIHCSNAQNVEFKNPTYKIIPSIIL
ncbi:hypothetical protein E4V92_03875, partial [Neisseria meningitidis]|nr:hypothetical protein [Neisseria meningitidis]